jgi:hypothetical protein
VRERDGVARTDAQAASASEIVDRARDDPEADTIELAEKRGDLPRERPVHEGLEEDRFRAVLAFVHRDQLAKDRVRTLTTGAPSLYPPDQTLSASTQRRIYQASLCRGVQVDRARSDVGTPRYFGDA